jgi:chromosome segregation ATPase
LQGIHGQEKEFDTLQSRLAPLVDFEGGVCNRLRLLQDTRAKLTSDLEGIERNDGIPLAERVQQIDEARSGLEQRVSEAKLRCEEIERALQGLMHQQLECDAIKSRLAPLVDSETGVRPRLRTLQDTHAELIGSLEGVEHDNGVPLTERVQEFTDSRFGLEQRVSALLEQVTKIETVQLEISALFAKLNQAHRVSRELDSNIRIVAQAG